MNTKEQENKNKCTKPSTINNLAGNFYNKLHLMHILQLNKVWHVLEVMDKFKELDIDMQTNFGRKKSPTYQEIQAKESVLS